MSEGFGRSAREEAAYRKILWPGSEVYRNKLGIRDAVTLEQAERMIVSRRVEQGFPVSCDPYCYAGFREMHRHMFQDIYDWAGQERLYTTRRGAAPFARPEHITTWMEDQFAALDAERFHMSRSRETFAREAAELVNEINAAHPFIDGNGRTQRQWLRALARNMGYRLDIQSADKGRWNHASRIGFVDSDHAPMRDLLTSRLGPTKRPHGRNV
ncbi:MAG: Fic family protein [Pseudomonadota bacterium]